MVVQSQKLSPPRVPVVVRRRRLEEKLTRTRDKKLALVTGQAAQGKSMLVSSYVQGLAEPYVWINLDRDDADPSALFLWIVKALKLANNELDISYPASLPTSILGPRANKPMFREWISAVYSLVSTPMQYILDGLDRLEDGESAFELLETFIEESPPHSRWIFLSRSLPPFDIERWEMNRMSVTIDNRDLAFTAQEIRTLCDLLRGLKLDASQALRMQQLTDGWIGGLILMIESLHREGTSSNGLNQLLEKSAKFKDRVFQYLADQVFNAQPETVRDFLCITSVLDTIEPRLAGRLTQISQTEPILEDLTSRNLFVNRHFDPVQAWVYRYHQLFREFLQIKLQAGYTLSDRRRWQTEAARLYESQDDPEQALQLYLDAEAWKEAVRILRTLGLGLLQTGRTGDLLRFLSALPAAEVDADPWLVVYKCAVQRFTAAAANIAALNSAAALFRKTGDRRGNLIAFAFLIEAQMSCGFYEPETIQESLQLLTAFPAEEYRFERTSLWYQIGFAETYRGDLRLAYNACENAIILARQLTITPLLINALINLVNILNYLGRHSRMTEVCREIESHLAGRDHPELRRIYHVGLTIALVFQGAPLEALALSHRTIKDIETDGLYYLLPISKLNHLLCLGHAGLTDELDRSAADTLALSQLMTNKFFETTTKLLWGMGLYRGGEYDRAAPLLTEALQVYRSEVPSPTHDFCAVHTAHLAALHERSPLDLDDLEKAHLQVTASGSTLFAADSHLVMTLVYHTSGRLEEARRHLTEGLSLTQKFGYHHFVFISNNDAALACSLAVAWRLTDLLPEAERLLTGALSEFAPDHLRPLLKQKKTGVGEQARRLLQIIRKKRLPQIHIQTMGQFTVFKGDVPATEDDWAGSMSRNLLKTLITLGPRRAPKEKIMEALWPEIPPKTAELNFKTALHRLRRALEPDMDPALGSTYIGLKEKTIYMTDQVAEIDFEIFERLYREAKKTAFQETGQRAIDALDDAIQAYSGKFLEEDPYGEGSADMQKKLQDRYIELMVDKAGIHEAIGQYRKAAACYRQVLDTDPINEEACRRLMNLHSTKGRRNEAIKVFHQLRQNLENTLGIEPEKLTRAIYEKIRNS